MSQSIDILVTDLRSTIQQLGKGGGQIGASVYDSAQVLRFAPPKAGVWAGINWLLEQQYADGGWGSPHVPLARDVPTAAALLALHYCGRRTIEHRAIEAGLAFLRRQVDQWSGSLREDIPLAAELLLPTLAAELTSLGYNVNCNAYNSLNELGKRRRQLLTKVTPQSGTPLAHSWEAWGSTPDLRVLDPVGGVGHSPSATAAWVRAAADRPELADQRAIARQYLVLAESATGTGIPGLVGAVWPYERNEQIVSLFTLLLAGLFDHPALTDLIRPIADELWRTQRPDGHGISDRFSTDGDLTAMSFAIMAAAGYHPSVAVLQQFLVDGACLTYRNEMQRSLSATAHAAHALAVLGNDPSAPIAYVNNQRSVSGAWLGDKWHASWLYLTSHFMHALLAAGEGADALLALGAILDHQQPDGSWGVTTATMEETAYAALALLALDRHGLLPAQGKAALDRAARYLRHQYRPLADHTGTSWIAKGLYRPLRIARIEETATLFACLQAGYGVAG